MGGDVPQLPSRFRVGAGVTVASHSGQTTCPNDEDERVARMDETTKSAPDKHQAHIFEPGPTVPLNPRDGATSQEVAGTESAVSPHASESSCALCGAPRNDQLHIDGTAEADSSSPRWGL